MGECPGCGAALVVAAKFCPECGERLLTAAPAAETRKIVTVVFCDVVGSTALGERLDPEAQRHVMTRYFDRMRAILEAHGGRVEKFIGDAVMAVFGVPVVHEDDALRAARAVAGMRDAVAELSADLERGLGVTLATRIGLNTGEVVVGDGAQGAVATGDAVNTAARLEQAASPGDVLLGEATYRLLAGVVDAVEVEAVQAKGKAEPVRAWRLLAVPEGTGRVEPVSADVPFVGRRLQLRMLRDAYERVIEEQICQLITVLGPAGTGKTRLVREFVDALGTEPIILRGRCLAYGEGIAFWPLLEMLRSAADLHGGELVDVARERIAALLGNDRKRAQVVDLLAPLAGLGGVPGGAEETQQAFRRLVAALAGDHPLVLVVDDVHWAEPAMLDLLGSVVALTRDAAVLVLCLARPEFIDRTPSWGAGAANATSIQLAPLPESDVALLVGELLGEAPVDPELVGVVREASDGNPLFVGQLLAMLRDDGRLQQLDGVWSLGAPIDGLELPLSISGLLRARLDLLPPAEREVLEAASVIGTEFYPGALPELLTAAGEATPGDDLVRLVRRDLVRPTESDIDGEDAYRFVHVLVKDVAYAAMSKQSRAQLHEQFARWLDGKADRSAAGNVDEFVGYHLEQAYALRRDLGAADAELAALGDRAGDRLARAGARLRLLDPRSAATAFARSVALVSDPGRRCDLLMREADAVYHAGDLAGARDRYASAVSVARDAGDDRRALTAQLYSVYVVSQLGGELDYDETLRVARDAEQRYGAADGVDILLAAAEAQICVGNYFARWTDVVPAAERGASLAAESGDAARALSMLSFLVVGLGLGPTPVPEALSRVRALEAQLMASASMRTLYHAYIALLLAFDDRPEEALVELSAAEEEANLWSDTVWETMFWTTAGEVEWVLGNRAATADHYRRTIAWLEERGEQAWLSTYAAEYAIWFLDDIGDAEARRLLGIVRETTAAGDAVSQAALHELSGLLASREGRHADAVALLQQAVDWADRTDQLVIAARTYDSRAGVLLAAGHDAEAGASWRRALELFEAKGDIAEARALRARLAAAADSPTVSAAEPTVTG